MRLREVGQTAVFKEARNHM